jgi:O-antigen/teichoic acid export membrane protein
MKAVREPSRLFREALGSNRALLTNAASMLGTTTVTSLLGAAFWYLAARGFSQDDVGLASGAVAAMTMLGFLATCGLGTLLMGELPTRPTRRRSLINAALASSFAIGAALGLVFALVAPLVSNAFDPLDSTALAAFAFVAGVGLTALVFVLDEALIGLLRGGLQLSRNTVFAAVKLVALVPIIVLVSDAGPAWIFGAWVVGIAASFVVLIRFFREKVEDDPPRPNFSLLGRMRGAAVSHYALNLGLEAANLSLPIIVVGLVSARANASFYVAWMVAGHLVIIPASLGTVLYPIGSADPERLARGLRLTLKLSFALGALANLVLLPIAGPLLTLFGDGYAEIGTTPLHILALGIFPLTIKALYVAIHRVEKKLRAGLPVIWAGALMELGGAAAGALLDGLTGVALGWLAAVCIQGAMMVPSIVRELRAPGTGIGGAALTGPEAEALDGLLAAAEDPRP